MKAVVDITQCATTAIYGFTFGLVLGLLGANEFKAVVSVTAMFIARIIS